MMGQIYFKGRVIIMIFLTTGEKIRNLRKKLGMRQQELEDKNITRAFISMVETGKRGLGRESARIIAAKFKDKASKLGLKISVDEEYILRTPEEDAEVYCNEKLNNNPTKDEIEVILEICSKYNLTKVEARSYKILGNYAFEMRNYREACLDYIISLDLYKDTEDNKSLPYLYNRIGYCKFCRSMYVEAIPFFERANYYALAFNNLTYQKYSLLNLAKTYQKLHRYEKALEYVDKHSSLCYKFNDYEGYIASGILKASCYNEKGNKEKAVALYMKLIEDSQNHEGFLWCLYNNLGLIYADENDFDKSKEFFDKAEMTVLGKDTEKLASTLIGKTVVYMKQSLYEESLEIANKGINLALKYGYTDLIIKGYNKLIDIYSALNDFINVRNAYIKLLDIMKNKEEYKDDVVKLYNNLALLYLEQNDVEMCKKYLSIMS